MDIDQPNKQQQQKRLFGYDTRTNRKDFEENKYTIQVIYIYNIIHSFIQESTL